MSVTAGRNASARVSSSRRSTSCAGRSAAPPARPPGGHLVQAGPHRGRQPLEARLVPGPARLGDQVVGGAVHAVVEQRRDAAVRVVAEDQLGRVGQACRDGLDRRGAPSRISRRVPAPCRTRRGLGVEQPHGDRGALVGQGRVGLTVRPGGSRQRAEGPGVRPCASGRPRPGTAPRERGPARAAAGDVLALGQDPPVVDHPDGDPQVVRQPGQSQASRGTVTPRSGAARARARRAGRRTARRGGR